MSTSPVQQTKQLMKDSVRFVRQKSGYHTVSDTPYLDESSLQLFVDRVTSASIYLEYGSGGSTVLAASLCSLVVSVETDRDYARSVRDTLASRNLGDRVSLECVNLGPTAGWGSPVFKWSTRRWRTGWKSYAEAPWDLLSKQTVELPDVVMIDGRFRVASFAATLLRIGACTPTSILVDDYESRPYYWVMESLADRRPTKGRMAEFVVGDCPVDRIVAVLNEYASDWR